MVKNKRKQSNRDRGHKPQAIKTNEWEQLAGNPTLMKAYTEFSVAMQRAQALAEQRSVRSGLPADELLDVTPAANILRQFPELTRYVDSVRRQEHGDALRASTMHPGPDMMPEYIRSSPTGSTPQASGNFATWTATKDLPSGVPNARLLRDWADANEWTRAAINVRRDQVSRAEIAIVPADTRMPYNKSVLKNVALMLDQPNELRTNWQELIATVLEDFLVLARGVISKNMTVARKPTALYWEDGATIKIYPAWDGDPNKPRYLYEEPGSNRKVPLRNDECIVMLQNPASYRFGLSTVQILRNTIQADLKATASAMQMVDMKPPPHAIQIPGASATQLQGMRDTYEREIAGRKEIFWFGGNQTGIHFPLIFSAKDNQWLEYQTYLAQKICALFQISPQQLGITMDINRANGEVQQDISEDTGLIPLLLLLESYLNREFLADFAPALPGGRVDLQALNLRIVFPMVSEASRSIHAQESLSMAAQGLAGLPAMTLNQVLLARGEEPVDGGDIFWIKTATGAVPWVGYKGATTGDYTPISTAGDLGAQDAAGGPSLDTYDPSEKADVSDADGSDISDSGSGADAASPAAADTGTASAAGDSAPAGKRFRRHAWIDTRPPGQHWRPSHMQRTYAARSHLDENTQPQIPPAEARARLRLQGRAKSIFEQAEKRGRQG